MYRYIDRQTDRQTDRQPTYLPTQLPTYLPSYRHQQKSTNGIVYPSTYYHLPTIIDVLFTTLSLFLFCLADRYSAIHLCPSWFALSFHTLSAKPPPASYIQLPTYS